MWESGPLYTKRIGDGDGGEGGGHGGKGKAEAARAAGGGGSRPAKGDRCPLTPFLHDFLVL